MKLSEKGFQEVRHICWEYNHNYLKIAEEIGFFDFKQEHFEGAVVLTVEEAKRVQSALYELLRNSNDKNSREWLTYWMVNGRIEQVEKKE